MVQVRGGGILATLGGIGIGVSAITPITLGGAMVGARDGVIHTGAVAPATIRRTMV